MTKRRSSLSSTRLVAAGSLAFAAALLLASSPADAHFILEEPACSSSQDSLGNPQKIAPCGDDGSAPTGIVTTVQSGQTIKITIDETIFHPGHYRIALAQNDRSELPDEPIVTVGSTACGSTEIQDPPVFPVLADGVLLHTKPFKGPQTIEITLPPDITCERCTLQILEFMSEHGLNNPGGCFYHHCADLAITGPAGSGGSAGAEAGGAAGAATGGMSAGGSPAGMSAGGTSAGGSSAGVAGASAGSAGAATAGTAGAKATGGSAGASAGASVSAGGKSAGGASAGGASAGSDGATADSSESDSGCSATTPTGARSTGAVALLLGVFGALAGRIRSRRGQKGMSSSDEPLL